MTQSKRITETYTIEQLRSDVVTDDDVRQLFVIAQLVSWTFKGNFNWKNFPFEWYTDNHRFMVCRRRGEIIGVMLARLSISVFDPGMKILVQDLLWVKDGYPRAAVRLLKDFVDFGRTNANHILTMTTPHTNIKPTSLEKLGFEKLETLYRLEV